MVPKKILLVQLNSNGDCLLATVIARQIKEMDYEGCHLTWAVNNHCKQSILLNPHVDEIWTVSTKKTLTSAREWYAFVQVAEKRKAIGDFDIIFYTQIIGKNFMRLNGDIRSSIYRNYPYPVKVPQQPVIRLSPAETENITLFSQQNSLEKFREVILVECGPESFRSSLNQASAINLAEKFISDDHGIAFILSSNRKIKSFSPRIIDGSVLSFRENAGLTKNCTLFIGCSSGISWLTTTDWAKPLKSIILINNHSVLNNSMKYDHEIAGLQTGDIIELQENSNSINKLKECLLTVLNDSFSEAKKKYDQLYKRKNFKYIYYVAKSSFEQGNFTYPFTAFRESMKKEGFSFNALFYLIKSYIKLPFYLISNGFSMRNKKKF